MTNVLLYAILKNQFTPGSAFKAATRGAEIMRRMLTPETSATAF